MRRRWAAWMPSSSPAGIGENVGRIAQGGVSRVWSSWASSSTHEKNATTRNDGFIEAADSKVKIMVVKTNEELAIARDTLELCGKK